MGCFGFSLPLKPLIPTAPQIDHDSYEALAAQVQVLLESWIEDRLELEIEEQFLDLADDVRSDACGHPDCDCFAGGGLHLSFLFTDHAPNVSAAVEHWFVLATVAQQPQLTALLAEHGFEVSVDQARRGAGDVVLVPTDEDIMVVDPDTDGAEAFATSEELPVFDELPRALQQRAQQARAQRSCLCSICSAQRSHP